jgi:hypothetical protein
MDMLSVVISSAAVGAVVSSLVNGAFNLTIKKWDARLQDLALAARLADLKHQQLVALQQWAKDTEGKHRPIELWDPLQTVIEYTKGLQEYRRKGQWEKAEASHRDAR